MRTINLDTNTLGRIGKETFEDITLEEYKSKWKHTLYSIQILCGGMGEPFSTNLERYNQVKELVNAMMETEFNRIHEKQNQEVK